MARFVPEYLGTSDPALATEATLLAIKDKTDNLDVALSSVSTAVTVSAGLTDAELRATPVPVSGTVTANAGSGTMAVSAASLPLPSGASTEATLALIKAKTDNLDVALSTRTKPADAQHAIIDSGTVTTVSTVTNVAQQGGVAISLNSGVRDAGTQRVTIATNDSVPVTGTFWQATQPVSGTVTANAGTNLNTSALALNATLIDGTMQSKIAAGGPCDGTNNVVTVAVKPIAASTYAPSNFQNLGANATLNVKSSTGNVLSLSCYNSNAASRFIQLHNTTTTPGAGATPTLSFLVPPSSQIIVGADFFTAMGVNFSTGIAFAFSTTMNTYTAGTAGDQSTFIEYK